MGVGEKQPSSLGLKQDIVLGSLERVRASLDEAFARSIFAAHEKPIVALARRIGTLVANEQRRGAAVRHEDGAFFCGAFGPRQTSLRLLNGFELVLRRRRQDERRVCLRGVGFLENAIALFA